MNLILCLAWIRLTEQPVKFLHLTITLATGVLAWFVLSTFISPDLLSNSTLIKSELALANGRAQNVEFPVHYIPRIQQISGIDNMYWFTAAAFFCADGSRTTVTVTGWDGNYDNQLRELGVSEPDLTTWHDTENGVLVGADISRQCGLTRGLTISPDNIFGNGQLPLYVVAVLPDQGKRNNRVAAHYNYVNRFMAGNLGGPRRDTVFRAIVNVTDPSRLDEVALAIEQEFQSDDPPLEATVLGDVSSLLSRYGQVQALLLLVMGALALCVLMTFIAITAHLVAQRRNSMAILQTLGFSGRIQFFGLMLELIAVLVIGVALGVASGYGVLTLLKAWATNLPFTGTLRPVDGARLCSPHCSCCLCPP